MTGGQATWTTDPPRPLGVRAGVWLLTLALLPLGGCANPGPPLPPSLKLPEIPADVTAIRTGDQVVLRWTTPAQTTDKIDIVDPGHAITAQICWEGPAAAASSGPQPPRSPAPCHPTLSVAVRPGATEAVDTLPPSLATGPSRMIGYRVELRNVHGRSAGLSAPAAVAAGAPLPPVDGLHATAGRNGATLEWAQAQATPSSPAAQFVELTRIQVGAPPGAPQTAGKTPAARSPQSAGTPTGPREPKELHLKVAISSGDAAPPGAIDRTAKVGYTYTYTAQRVRTVPFPGQQVEQRSAPSAAVTVAMLDIFPPGPPTGLAASPGFTGEAAPRPAIDLSWQPSPDTRIAGYLVYRVAGPGAASAATTLTPQPVLTLAFRDATVAPGSGYTYFVTAVDTAGNESLPSRTVFETAPTP